MRSSSERWRVPRPRSARLAEASDAAIETFFEGFADALADDTAFAPIAEANTADVAAARSRGRSTTRLVLSPSMRQSMIAGLRRWITLPSGRGQVVETTEHDGWSVQQVRAGLGVVGFVFEGRPNVFADAAGVVRSGNTAVFRIGSDALGTARAIVTHAVEPSLRAAGLPAGTLQLVDAPERSAGWALFDHPGLSLAVARGSGAAVAELGAVARQAGTPVSLHGTGGGWLIAGRQRVVVAIRVSDSLVARSKGLQHAERGVHPRGAGRRVGPGRVACHRRSRGPHRRGQRDCMSSPVASAICRRHGSPRSSMSCEPTESFASRAPPPCPWPAWARSGSGKGARSSPSRSWPMSSTGSTCSTGTALGSWPLS